ARWIIIDSSLGAAYVSFGTAEETQPLSLAHMTLGPDEVDEPGAVVVCTGAPVVHLEFIPSSIRDFKLGPAKPRQLRDLDLGGVRLFAISAERHRRDEDKWSEQS